LADVLLGFGSGVTEEDVMLVVVVEAGVEDVLLLELELELEGLDEVGFEELLAEVDVVVPRWIELLAVPEAELVTLVLDVVQDGRFQSCVVELLTGRGMVEDEGPPPVVTVTVAVTVIV